MPDILWEDLKAEQLRQLAKRDAIVVIPVAAMEQHGPHLPVKVDTLLCSAICRRAAEITAGSDSVVVTPPVWTGLSEHHISFGGTFTLDYPAFYGLLRGLVRSLVRQGFRRIAFVNGHGGNVAAIEVAAGELAVEFRVPILAATYWRLADEAFAQILERQKTVRHACEAETSMMLRLAPELVDTSLLADAHGRAGPDPQHLIERGTYRWMSFASRTDTGVIGDAALASAEKGERLLAAASEALARGLLNPESWADRF